MKYGVAFKAEQDCAAGLRAATNPPIGDFEFSVCVAGYARRSREISISREPAGELLSGQARSAMTTRAVSVPSDNNFL